MSEEASMVVIEEKPNQANMEQESMTLTKSDDLEAICSGSHSVLTQESVPRELPTSIRNVSHNAFAASFEVLRDVSVRKNSRNGKFE